MINLQAALQWTGAQISQSFCSVYYYGKQIAKSPPGQLFNDYVVTPVTSCRPSNFYFCWDTTSVTNIVGSIATISSLTAISILGYHIIKPRPSKKSD